MLFDHVLEGVIDDDTHSTTGMQWLLIKKAPRRQGFMYRVIKF
jgi:hypothetical protein